MSAPDTRQQVFLSYGRADATEFALRLKADLERDGRYRVWLDQESMAKGGPAGFDVHIEQAIQGSAVVGAVVTLHSVREQSVCRAEIVFALNEGKKVIPLRLSAQSRLTLLLCNLNWIDFTESYEKGLGELLGCLEGDETALHPPPLPTITGVAPLDFSLEIARHADGFTGRAWLAREIDRWLAEGRGRALVLTGEPGVGKSAVAAWLCRERPEVLAVHVCTHRNSRALDPYEFVASLVRQLHAELPEFARLVEGRQPAVRRATAADAFRELIVEPARQLAAPPRPRLVIVDALDEAAGRLGETIAAVLARQAPDLPPWLRLLATTRPEARVLDQVRSLGVYELKADQPENREDVAEYIRARLGLSALAGRVGAEVGPIAQRLEQLAGGNFLYARLALDALEEGSLAAADLGRIAPGLAGFYADTFRQRFPDPDEFGHAYERLLIALVAAHGPLSFGLLQRVGGGDAKVVHRRLRDLRPYLRVSGGGDNAGYAVFHQSLRDWLTDREAAGDYWCEPAQGHSLLADVLSGQGAGDEYGLRHRVAHLLSAARAGQAAELLLHDWRFLEAKAEAGLVFDVAGDFRDTAAALPAADERRRLLELLEEAIRRDVHFLARHPSALFQCLWNSCWWYDCPEAAAHYDLPAQRPGGQLWPWERRGLKLAELLDRWRAGKDNATPGFVWLRSLRPPPVHLGTAQRAILRGHEDGVTGVCFSPEGRRLASVSRDGTVRLWGAADGAELPCLCRHNAGVTGVCFSPDGKRMASCSRDRTVRVWDAAGGAECLCLRGHDNIVTGVSFAADGSRLASASRDGTVRIWNATSGAELLCLCGHEGGVTGVCFSPDGRRLASASWDGTVRVWNAASGAQRLCLCGHEGWVTGVCFSPDGRRLASASDDRTIRVWDALGGSELLRLCGHEDRVTAVCFSSDGRYLASGSWDGTVRVWDAAGAAECLCLRGHNNVVTGVSFCPDGGRLASASDDRTVRVWNATGGAEQLRLHGHEDWLTGMCFSPDGRRLVSTSDDQTVRAWDFQRGVCLEVASGKGDVMATCAESPSSPWHAVTHPLETVIEYAASSESVAWLPGDTRLITAHPAGRAWAGAVGSYLSFFVLEGEAREGPQTHSERLPPG
jgi:WD40 repeat protein